MIQILSSSFISSVVLLKITLPYWSVIQSFWNVVFFAVLFLKWFLMVMLRNQFRKQHFIIENLYYRPLSNQNNTFSFSGQIGLISRVKPKLVWHNVFFLLETKNHKMNRFNWSRSNEFISCLSINVDNQLCVISHNQMIINNINKN